MKINTSYLRIFVAGTLIALTSCNDFLDKEPLSNVAPESYFTQSTHLEAYANRYYTSILPTHGNFSYGIFGQDNNTDNQIGVTAHNRYTPDRWKVPHSEGSDWDFESIYRCNYFFSEVLPKFGENTNGSANTIGGDLNDIKHYIGELYFLRASEYFKKLQLFGDFPIITEPLADNMETLREASKRSPRNEVARFILGDLDKAYLFLSAKEMATTRINKDVAMLLKSRVALFEATWLKYFKGTAFVPRGEGWPGSTKEYTANYQYPGGSIDDEINFFLEQAITASKEVAEAYKGLLTENKGYFQQLVDEPANPFYDMYADEDLSTYKEVLLWRQAIRALSQGKHNVNIAASRGNYRTGLTRGYVNNFLMADGTPVYLHGSYAQGDGYYMGDMTLADVRVNRDSRLAIFLKEPDQKNIIFDVDNPEGADAMVVEPYPEILSGDSERAYATGYALRKGGSLSRLHYGNGNGYTGVVCYRAAEALLNYMEASYEKEGTLNSTAREYWTILRERAHVSTDIDKTIALTDMAKEAENDWGAYSAGTVIDDAVLYNIRRERRSEMLAEGLRYMDLRRWRSLDQLKTTPVHLEGFHLWNTPMERWYDDADGETRLVADGSSSANVSSKERSEYLRPFERYPGQAAYDGVTWKMAHYLTPIMVKQFQVTAESGADVSTSPLYQNPYWPIEADQPATQ